MCQKFDFSFKIKFKAASASTQGGGGLTVTRKWIELSGHSLTPRKPGLPRTMEGETRRLGVGAALLVGAPRVCPAELGSLAALRTSKGTWSRKPRLPSIGLC